MQNHEKQLRQISFCRIGWENCVLLYGFFLDNEAATKKMQCMVNLEKRCFVVALLKNTIVGE